MRAAPTYGPLKRFEDGKTAVFARTKAEAAQKLGVAASTLSGPSITDALRGEPTGNRRHPDVTYLGNRAAVRRLNRAA